ncbi:hypothetical protein [Streptomyces sp. FH025]|uniref:hypothetical protein n=1 Tax=Streptomyces sp. FH025 TaxID=2815937 RepID=UPI001A9E252F|nr:hypothetical protein [Streptomyces sp. FH025]MBO1419173.1 hypothetical protein [Streptomyces sp. FH025]
MTSAEVAKEVTPMGERPEAPATGGGPSASPASFLAAAAALAAMDEDSQPARRSRRIRKVPSLS